MNDKGLEVSSKEAHVTAASKVAVRLLQRVYSTLYAFWKSEDPDFKLTSQSIGFFEKHHGGRLVFAIGPCSEDYLKGLIMVYQYHARYGMVCLMDNKMPETKYSLFVKRYTDVYDTFCCHGTISTKDIIQGGVSDYGPSNAQRDFFQGVQEATYNIGCFPMHA